MAVSNSTRIVPQVFKIMSTDSSGSKNAEEVCLNVYGEMKCTNPLAGATATHGTVLTQQQRFSIYSKSYRCDTIEYTQGRWSSTADFKGFASLVGKMKNNYRLSLGPRPGMYHPNNT